MRNVTKPDWEAYASWLSVAPSYLDTIEMINQNLQNECLAEATIKGKCVGFIIFQSISGRISQIGVDPNQRKKGIGSALIRHCYHESKNKSLTLINVEKEDGEIVSFFTNRGFQYQLDQYEMELRI
jgi:ribosomal protein S18 acetylase RimI-like enzyme